MLLLFPYPGLYIQESRVEMGVADSYWYLQTYKWIICFLYLWTLALLASLQFSSAAESDYLGPHGLQHSKFLCPSPSLRTCSNSCPLSWWCYPSIFSSILSFSSCFQSFPASGSFPVSQFFASGGQSIGASASTSVLPMSIQDWFPLGMTGWISLQSKGLPRVFFNTTV